MIADFLEFLAGGIFDFLDGLLGIFPEMTINADVLADYTGSGTVSSVLSWLNYFLPLDVAGVIIGLWAVAMITYLGIKMAMKYTGELL